MSYKLEWFEGHPTGPGRYLFQFPKDLNNSTQSIVLALVVPTGHDWCVIDVWEENGMLLYTHPDDDEPRVVTTIHIWWAKLHD